jgi:hypothetical protein
MSCELGFEVNRQPNFSPFIIIIFFLFRFHFHLLFIPFSWRWGLKYVCLGLQEYLGPPLS